MEVFQPQDLRILNTFLRQIELSDNTLDPGGPDDCVRDGCGWPDTKNLARLKREHGIRPTRIIVQAGDTVVIPARSPCQVRHPVLIDRFQSTDDRLIDALLVRLDRNGQLVYESLQLAQAFEGPWVCVAKGRSDTALARVARWLVISSL